MAYPKTKKFTTILYAAVIAFLIIMFAGIAITDRTSVSGKTNKMDIMHITDLQESEVQSPDSPIGIYRQYEFTLGNEITDGINLAFYTVHQYVTVSIDGKEVYSLYPASNGNKRRITKTVGSHWAMIPLHIKDAGKQVKIEIIPVYESFRNRQMDFLIGMPYAIYRDRLQKDLPQLVLSALAVIIGIIFMGIAGVSVLRRRTDSGLACLGLFSVMVGLWRLLDSRFTPFMDGGHPIFVYYISIAMMMLGLLPFLRWTRNYFSQKGCRVLQFYEIFALLVCLFQFILQILGIRDIRETLLLAHITIGMGAVCLALVIIYERICLSKDETPTESSDAKEMKARQTSHFPPQLRLGLICVVGILLDVVKFYIRGNSSGLVFTLLAFLIYVVCMGLFTMQQYGRQQAELARLDRQLAEQDLEIAKKNRELAEQERRMTDGRIMAMLSQIRSHFIFNVLATISTYCKIDPKTADKALICFSRYLRRNIKNIEEDGLIDFAKELEQVEDYVELEKMRFAERITFITDIETTSFQIPPLTIQPLVENAIKHGIIEQGRRGTITLTTQRVEHEIRIQVVDDGVGFDIEELGKSESVGIRNVRYRLENMTDGTITFASEPGKGTTVTICIPNEL